MSFLGFLVRRYIRKHYLKLFFLFEEFFVIRCLFQWQNNWTRSSSVEKANKAFSIGVGSQLPKQSFTVLILQVHYISLSPCLFGEMLLKVEIQHRNYFSHDHLHLEFTEFTDRGIIVTSSDQRSSTHGTNFLELSEVTIELTDSCLPFEQLYFLQNPFHSD